MIVREVSTLDVDALIPLVKEHVEELQSHIGFEEDVIAYYADLSTKPEAFFKLWVCIADDGRLIGYLVANASPYMYCRKYSAGMQAMYVQKASRGSKAAMLLVQAYEDWATNTIKAKEVFIGVDHGINTERVGRFFNKMGFEPTGAFYRKVNDD